MAGVHSWDDYCPVTIAKDHPPCPVRDLPHKIVPKPAPPPTTDGSSLRCVRQKPHQPLIGELTYFPLRARAEPVRMIMHYAGQAYTLRTVSLTTDQWPTMKPTIPKGQLPVFRKPVTADGPGEVITETSEIAKYVASLSLMPGLFPKDAAAQAEADKLFCACMDGALHACTPLTNWHPASEAEPQLKAAVAEAVKALKALEGSKKGAFFGGADPHYGEFAVYHVIDILKTADADVLKALGPAYEAWFGAMSKLEGLAFYLEHRPKAMSKWLGKPGSRITANAFDGEVDHEAETL